MNLLKLILAQALTSPAASKLRPGQTLRLDSAVKGRITQQPRRLDWLRACEQGNAHAAAEQERHRTGPHRSRHLKRRSE